MAFEIYDGIMQRRNNTGPKQLLDTDDSLYLGQAANFQIVSVRPTGDEYPPAGTVFMWREDDGNWYEMDSTGAVAQINAGAPAIITSTTGPTIYSEGSYTVFVTGSPTGGTYTLTVNGETTVPIPFDDDGTAATAALATVAAALGYYIEVSIGSAGDFPIVVAPTYDTASVVITSDPSGLTGGTSPDVDVTEDSPYTQPSNTGASLGTFYFWTNGGGSPNVYINVPYYLPDQATGILVRTWQSL